IYVTGNPLTVQGSGDLFREKLAAYIHELIREDFEKLVSILYRLDVNENKLKTLLEEKADDDAGMLIADAIIERQAEKITSRKKYSSINKDIPEDEKW
ncbi:MAG: hypothetical protein ABI861_02985, partial [Panacibacter sp.]